MAIKISQYQGKWRIEIVEESWEFDTRKDFELELKKLFDMKDKYGRIQK